MLPAELHIAVLIVVLLDADRRREHSANLHAMCTESDGDTCWLQGTIIELGWSRIDFVRKSQ